MLILTRRRGESLIINGNIKITILDGYGNGAIKIGITAPKEITVDREEIHERRIRGWDKNACDVNVYMGDGSK